MHTFRNIAVGVLVAALVIIVPQQGVADSRSTADLARELESLLRQVESLQRELSSRQHTYYPTTYTSFPSALTLGARGQQVAMVQQILASDPTIYPEGLVTGYFGPLTHAALVRFQQRFGLLTTGSLTSETSAELERIRAQGGIIGHHTTYNPCYFAYCFDDDIDEIVATIDSRDDETRVRVEYEDGSVERYTITTTRRSRIIDVLADELDLDEDDVEDLIEFDYRRDDDEVDRIDVTIDTYDDDARARVRFEDGDTTTYYLDTDDEDDIIEELADLLDLDEDDVEDLIDFDYR